MTSDADAMLLQQYVSTQDPVAFDQLARRYRAMVFSVARRVTQSHHDAEDVAQSCFLELARKAASIRSSIPAFLHATATRRSIDLLRDRKRRLKYETEAIIDRPEAAAQQAVERSWDEISPEVDQAIDRLPDELKTFVILYFLRGLTIADIVVETGINRGIVERRLQVGVRRLRADLVKGNKIVTAGALAMGLRASAAHAVPATLTAATGRMALAAVLQPRAPGNVNRLRLGIGPSNWLSAAVAGGLVAVSVFAFHALTLRGPQHVAPDPYDRMNRLYAAYLPNADVAGFTLHTASMRDDLAAFWRGSQPLFFQWCGTNCSDWVADKSAYTRCNASPNLEDAQRLAILPSTDNSSALPVQIELLQGLLIARLASDRNVAAHTTITPDQVAEVLCETYRSALLGELPQPQPNGEASEMLGSDQYVDSSGNFRSLILGEQQKLLAFLRPSPIDPVQVQRMVDGALVANPVLRAFCGNHPKVRQVRACVRHNAVVNQGQMLLIVQLANTPRMLELQQQTPAPAELAGIVQPDPRPPAQRAAEDAAVLSASRSAAVGWCQWNQLSFTVVPLDLHPQVYELRKDRWVDPLDAARIWATATGLSHRADPNCQSLAQRITPQLQAELVERSSAYLDSMQQDLRSFNADPRVAKDRAAVEALELRWLEASPHEN